VDALSAVQGHALSQGSREPLQRLSECQYHFYLPARERIQQVLDPESFEEWFTNLSPCDPLGFKDRIPYATASSRTGQDRHGRRRRRRPRLHPRPAVVLGITDFAFMAGSMGSVVGEKLTLAAEEAKKRELPLIFISGSGGGARMQEGILSLMQMAKVSAALGQYDTAGGLYISILTNPTMGGVAASFALQGDVTLAEPGALIASRAGAPSGIPCGWSCRKASRPASLPAARLHRPHRSPHGPAHRGRTHYRLCEH